MAPTGSHAGKGESMKKLILLCSLLLLLGFGAVPDSPAETDEVMTGEEINWQVVSSGGTSGSSADFILNGTTAQTAVGPAASASFEMNSGFWQVYPPGVPCCNLPGDANDNEAVNILDVTYLINYLYKYGPPPPCMPEGDANGNGAVNILDVTRIINYLYLAGSPPVCGPDPWPY